VPEAEPDPYSIRLYFRIGLVLLIPVAVILFLFCRAAVDTGALDSAKPCSVSTQDPASRCLSQFQGVVTGQTPEYRSPTRLTISVGSSTVNLGWTCLNMSTSSCLRTSFPPGTKVVTEWWSGRVVRLGMADGQPAVITDANPEYDAVSRGPYPLIALLALGPIAMAGLLRQAPMSVNKLLDTSFDASPEVRKAVPRAVILRVAMGGWGGYGVLIWLVLYLASLFAFAGSSQWSLGAPFLWLSAAVIGFAFTWSTAYLYLSRLVRTSNREAVTVTRIKYGVGRNHSGMQVWYELRNGTLASRYVGPQGLSYAQGDRMDALTDPRSGKVRRLLSSTPAQA